MRKQNRLFIMALSLVLCLSVSIGLTVAYFTDYENARGGAVLRLKGQTEIEEHADDKSKTISILNVDRPDMLVRVMIIADESHLGDVTLGDGWKKSDDDGWYYYTKVLKGSPKGTARENLDSTTDLVAQVKADGDENVDDFDIVVVHEAERVVYEQDKDGENVVSIPEGWALNAGDITVK